MTYAETVNDGPLPGGCGRWLAELAGARTPEQLRVRLLEHHPAFDPAKLRRIAILGAAGEGRRLAALCRHHGIEVAAIADDDPGKVGTSLLGHSVLPTAALAARADALPVVIASHRVLAAIHNLQAMGRHDAAPFAVLQVLAPDKFSPHMFYDHLLEDTFEHRDRYQWLADELADDVSRQVLDAVLGFRQTLDARVLEPVVDDDLYAPAGLMRFADDEAYVDGGSYDGDTIRLFIGRVGGRFERVYAFEPDPRTFAALTRNFVDEPRVRPINAGLYSRTGTLRFHDDGSRGAIFAEDGEIDMTVTTIDEVVGDGRVTFIKMNIEGAEIDALDGARRTIARCLPKLAISAYHRPNDLWRIALLVRELSSKYQLFLRQHDGGVIETVLYALPREHRPSDRRSGFEMGAAT
ncbi:MAG: FkbM family methyltransferase [Xanthobacteraceae bacterium]